MATTTATADPASSELQPLEVDYDTAPTRLYESIASEDWVAALDAVTNDVVEARTWVVRRRPGQGGRGVMWRFLPLHSACARQPTAELVSALLAAYPGGASSRDDEGMLPLHYACGNQANTTVIQLLLEANPSAASATDPNGMLPIHYLAKWGPSGPDATGMLLNAHKFVSDVKAFGGMTPIDMAREGDYPERDDVIAALERLSEPTPKKKPLGSPRRGRGAPVPGVPSRSDKVVVAKVVAPPSSPSEASSTPTENPAGEDSGGTRAEEKKEDSAEEPSPVPVQKPPQIPQPDTPKTPVRPAPVSVSSPYRPVPGSRSRPPTPGSPGSQPRQRAVTPSTPRSRSTSRSRSRTADAESPRGQRSNSRTRTGGSGANATTISRLVRELQAVKKEIAELKEGKEGHADFVRSVEKRITQRDSELMEANKEVEKLREELKEATVNHNVVKKKADYLGNCIGAIMSAVTTMEEDHAQFAKEFIDNDDRRKEEAKAREDMLRELLETDVNLEVEYGDKKHGKIGWIHSELDKQKEELEEAVAILEAARNRNEEWEQ